MSLALRQLIKRTKAKLAATKDPKQRKMLTATVAQYESALEAYKRVKKVVKYEAESDEDGEEDDAAEEKGNETDRKEDDDGDDDSPPKDDDSDEEDEAEEEDEEEEAEEEEEEAEEKMAASSKAARSVLELAQSATGKRGRAAIGALAAMLEEGSRASAKIAAIEKERRAEKRSAMIERALNAHRITKREAKTLRGKPLSFVSSFLEMRPKAIFNATEDELLSPSEERRGELSAESMRSVEEAMASMRDRPAAEQKAMREKLIEKHKQRQMNGAAGGR